jgi:hypothetical protein
VDSDKKQASIVYIGFQAFCPCILGQGESEMGSSWVFPSFHQHSFTYTYLLFWGFVQGFIWEKYSDAFKVALEKPLV